VESIAQYAYIVMTANQAAYLVELTYASYEKRFLVISSPGAGSLQ
jgi:hypothetical protein